MDSKDFTADLVLTPDEIAQWVADHTNASPEVIKCISMKPKAEAAMDVVLVQAFYNFPLKIDDLREDMRVALQDSKLTVGNLRKMFGEYAQERNEGFLQGNLRISSCRQQFMNACAGMRFYLEPRKLAGGDEYITDLENSGNHCGDPYLGTGARNVSRFWSRELWDIERSFRERGEIGKDVPWLTGTAVIVSLTRTATFGIYLVREGQHDIDEYTRLVGAVCHQLEKKNIGSPHVIGGKMDLREIEDPKNVRLAANTVLTHTRQWASENGYAYLTENRSSFEPRVSF